MAGPLSDIRVLDIATFIAAPFYGTIMAEFESPRPGSPTRS